MNGHLFIGLVFATVALGCAQPQRAAGGPVTSSRCGATAVTASDLSLLNVSPTPGKVKVVRMIRSSCPYCRDDLMRMGLLFKGGEWKTDAIQVVVIGYRKEKVENRKTFDEFVRDELPQFGIPLEAMQVIYLDKTYPALKQTKTGKGERMLAGWQAVPYGLAFGRDGRLVYAGQFTVTAKDQDEHYQMITKLQTETCQP